MFLLVVGLLDCWVVLDGKWIIWLLQNWVLKVNRLAYDDMRGISDTKFGGL